MTDVVAFKYRAFISYSHGDTTWAKWLHRALESFHIDKGLVGRTRSMALAAFSLLAGPGLVLAAEPTVHDGITKQELVEFAERQGWQADASGSGNDLTIRVGDESLFVIMMDCDAGGSCRSGLIRNQTYYFIKSPGGACHLWHWNLETKGATGFGPNYVTLQRYLNFRGVTDQYLKDSIDAYVRASPSFWKLVETCTQPDQ